VIAESKQLAEEPHEDEGPQVQTRTPQPEAAQPAGAGPLLNLALHERIAQAVRPVLEELRQRNAQARPPVAQARPVGQGGEEQEEEPPHALERAPQPEAAQKAAPAYVFDEKGRLIAELKRPVEQPQEDARSQVPERAPQPAEQPHEEEQPHVPERAPQPEAAQPAGAGPLLNLALHERIAQAVRPVLEELRQRNAQARPPMEQARAKG
jgi:hypothetical protein